MRIVTRKPLKPSPIDRLIAQCYNVATNEGRAMKTTVKKDTVIRARINSKVKDEAAAVLATHRFFQKPGSRVLIRRVLFL